MTYALQFESSLKALHHHEKQPFLMCSMLSNDNAVWIEELSFDFLNPKDRVKAASKELSQAHKEWYLDESGRPQYKQAYQALLKKLPSATK